MAKTAKTNSKKPTHDEIARLAYKLFEESGHVPGRDLDNWLQAEALLSGSAKPTSAAAAARSEPVKVGLLRK